MKKRLLSMLMVLSMLMTLVPAAAAKAPSDSDDGVINYVSLGDSMTNGLGLSGYYRNGYLEVSAEAYPAQFAAWLAGDPVVEDGKSHYEGSKGVVDLTQLAVSAGRVEDLHYILEYGAEDVTDPYPGDSWTMEEMNALSARFGCPNNGYCECGQQPCADKVAIYQNVVRNADVITMAIGNGNFGVYLMDMVMTLIGMGGYGNDYTYATMEGALELNNANDEIKAIAEEVYDNVLPYLTAVLGEEKGPIMADRVGYVVVSFLINYNETLCRIVEMNPDVDVIFVPLMNSMAGVTVDMGNGTTMDMGDMMAYIMDPLNAYIAALPAVHQLLGEWSEANFYCAESVNIDVLVNTYAEAINDPNSAIRDRFVDSVTNGLPWEVAGPMFNALVNAYGLQMVKLDLDTVEAYEEFAAEWEDYLADYAVDPETAEEPSAVGLSDNEILSAAVYLAFEQAILKAAAPDSMMDIGTFTSLLGGKGNLGSAFNGVAAALDPNAIVNVDEIGGAVLGNLAPETMAAIQAELLADEAIGPFAAGRGAFYQGALTAVLTAAMGGAPATEEQKDAVQAIMKKLNITEESALTGVNPAYIEAAITAVTFDDIMAGYGDKVIAAVFANEDAKPIASHYVARYVAAAITDPLYNALTDEDETTLQGLLYLFARMLLNNGMGCHPSAEGHAALLEEIVVAYEGDHTAEDETIENVVMVLGAAYQYLLENYEAVYKKAYEYAADEVAVILGYLTEAEEQVAALQFQGLGLSDELVAKLEALQQEVLADIAALKTMLGTSDHPTAEEFWALVDELYDDLAALQAVAEQAGIDGYAQLMVVYTALKGQLDAAFQAALEQMDEQFQIAYKTVVDELIKLDADLEKYLGQDPQAVLDAVLKYGADIDAFLNYWGYYAGLIVGPAWNAYGDELIAYLESARGALLEGLESEGTKAAAELVAYIESLNLIEQVEAIAKAVEDGSVALGEKTLAELSKVVGELDADVQTNVGTVVKALETLAEAEDAADAKAAVENAIVSVLNQEEALLAEIAKVEEDILAVKAQMADAVVAVKTLYRAAATLKALVENPDEVDFSAGVDAVTAAVGILTETAGLVQGVASSVLTLSDDVDAAAKKIDKTIVQMYSDLKTAAEAAEGVIASAGADAEALMADTYAAIEALVTTTAGKVTTDASALLALCEQEAFNAVIEVLFGVYSALYDAVYAEYTVDCDSYYVSIGDEADAYTSELAELLALTEAQVGSALAEADLVTVEFGADNFGEFMAPQMAGIVAEAVKAGLDGLLTPDSVLRPSAEQMMAQMGIDLNATAADLEWKNLDAEAVSVIEDTLEGIKITLKDNNILPEFYQVDLNLLLGVAGSDLQLYIPVAEIAVDAAEAALCAYVSFLAEYGAALDEIRAEAPEAVIAVLGLEAPEALTLNIAGMEIDLSEYTNVVEAINSFINVHYFAYAMGAENTIYVSENEAEAIYAALNVTSNSHVWGECVAIDDEYHAHTCQICGEVEKEEHVFGDDDICDHCGYEKKEVAGGGSGGGLYGFSDVSRSHPFYKEIMWAFRKGYVQGYDDGTFRPGNSLSRQHVWMILARHAGEKPADMAEARAWAMANGVSDGTNPGASVTRQQLVAMFFRYATLKGYDVTAETDISTYPDVAGVAAYAKDPMEWAIAEGIIKGYTDGSLQAPGLTNRGQFAAVLYRFCDAVK